MSEFRANNLLFMQKDTQVLGVSCDSRATLAAYNISLGASDSYPVRLLSDFHPHGAVTRAYGLFNDENGAPFRAVVIVDKQGVVRFSRRYTSVRKAGPTGQGETESDLNVTSILEEIDNLWASQQP
jgi:alkyl hydroperoxide reductase subunit AhpC